jgi:hypothetical protein
MLEKGAVTLKHTTEYRWAVCLTARPENHVVCALDSVDTVDLNKAKSKDQREQIFA